MRKLFSIVFSAVLLLIVSAQGTWGQNEGLPAGRGGFAPGAIRHTDRTVLHGDIVHYRYDVTVGPGKFDRIRLHRIVREKHPWQPIHTATGVLMLPGGPNTVEMIFIEPLISSVLAWDHSIAVFLAKNNIDVWGMDYRWALVPDNTKDFKFMKNWGIQRDVADTKIALSLARLIRGATGQSFSRLHLLGFSYGAYVGYALANQETQWPDSLRNVKGLIPLDASIVYPADDPFRAQNCDLLAQDQARYDAGEYNDDYTDLRQIGELARSVPDDPSPFADGFTNFQFALFAGASGDPPLYWHFVAGIFNLDGITTGLQYTDPRVWIDVLRAVPLYFPVLVDIDGARANCYDVAPPFTDHLGEITLPILYVGSGGGEGTHGYYSLTRTASTDITKFSVQLHPDDERAIDFAHVDLLAATDAKTLVWQPILDWLVAHR